MNDLRCSLSFQVVMFVSASMNYIDDENFQMQTQFVSRAGALV